MGGQGIMLTMCTFVFPGFKKLKKHKIIFSTENLCSGTVTPGGMAVASGR